MRRRNAIVLFATGSVSMLAGCSTDDDVRLENFSKHDHLNVSFTGKVIQQPSEENPLRVELRFTNDGPERTFGFLSTPPLSFLSEISVLPVPDDRESISPWDPDGPDGFVPDSPDDDGCWRALNQSVTNSAIELHRRTLDPEEALIDRYTLLAIPEAEECFPSGTHRCESSVYLDGTEHTLSFDLVVP